MTNEMIIAAAILNYEKESGKKVVGACHTYQRWQQLGFQVQKGSKALFKAVIWRVCKGKKNEKVVANVDEKTDVVEDGERSEKMVKVTACFFDESQVKPIEELEDGNTIDVKAVEVEDAPLAIAAAPLAVAAPQGRQEKQAEKASGFLKAQAGYTVPKTYYNRIRQYLKSKKMRVMLNKEALTQDTETIYISIGGYVMHKLDKASVTAAGIDLNDNTFFGITTTACEKLLKRSEGKYTEEILTLSDEKIDIDSKLKAVRLLFPAESKQAKENMTVLINADYLKYFPKNIKLIGTTVLAPVKVEYNGEIIGVISAIRQ